MDTVKEFDIEITFPNNLQNNIDTYIKLIESYYILNLEKKKTIALNFSKITFISANLFALLGCCLDSTCQHHNHRIFITDLHPKIKAVIQKNGFNKYFNMSSMPDIHKSTIKYTVFESTTEHLASFEKYLLLNVFTHSNNIHFPCMSSSFKDRIVDNFLEIFNNVIDHANSNNIYVCGQLFPKKSRLCFTIVDLGNTIQHNVSRYLSEKNIPIPQNTLEWAIQRGNSTKKNVPGGLGFSILIDFLRKNSGGFTIISGNEVYELCNRKERFKKIDVSFPGTIVTITINLDDKQLYFLDDSQNNIIVF